MQVGEVILNITSFGWLNILCAGTLAGFAGMIPILLWSLFGNRSHRRRMAYATCLVVCACVVLIVLLVRMLFYESGWEVLRMGPSPQSMGIFLPAVVIISSTMFVIWWLPSIRGEWGRIRLWSFIGGTCILITSFMFFSGLAAEDTEIADGYSVRLFESVYTGDSLDEVYRILGAPIYLRTNSHGNVIFDYSYAQTDGWRAYVEIQDSKVVGKFRDWTD